MKSAKNKSKTTTKHKNKKKTTIKPKKEKVLVVAQEFKFARLLSGNEKKTRDRVLKTLKKWLLNCFEKKYEFKKDDFIRVWKGLFYAVWMSDKPLVQEDLCENISAILDLFPPEQLTNALLMVEAGFQVLAMEWYGIDHHRMDKFMMLVRRYLRGAFRCLLRSNWSMDSCKRFTDMLTSGKGILALKTPQYARNALSLILHITDCYLEELSKVSKGKIPEDSMAQLVSPFCEQVCGGEALAVSVAARKLLTSLLRQSHLGLDYEDATRAWQEMGCPAGGPEALELVPDDEEDQTSDTEEDQDGPLDPRAGRVSVSLCPLPVPARQLAVRLRQLLSTASSRAHKRTKLCLERFEELSRNVYPLRVLEPEPAPEREPELEPDRAARRLRSLERKLVSEADELALRGLRRKHRKRLLSRARAGASLVDELGLSTDTTDGNWKVEDTEPSKKTNKRECNKENEDKGRKRKLPDNAKKAIKKPKVDTDKRKTDKDKQISKKDKVKKKNKDRKDILKVKDTKVNHVKNIKDNGDIKGVNDVKDKDNVKCTKDNVKDGRNKNVKDLKDKNNIRDTKDKNVKDSKSNQNTIDKVKTIKDVTTEINKTKNDSKKIEKSLQPKVLVNKVKNFQKNANSSPKKVVDTPKKVKFVLKNNGMQAPVDYYKSVRQSPNIPFDGTKRPVKTNLKPSSPSPINPFFKKKLRRKN